MHDGLTAVAALLLVAAAVGFAARRLGIHYNIALVVAGAATGRWPRVPARRPRPRDRHPGLPAHPALRGRDLHRPSPPARGHAAGGAARGAGHAPHRVRGGRHPALRPRPAWPVALLLGAILAATDTIAVVATFRKVRRAGPAAHHRREREPLQRRHRARRLRHHPGRASQRGTFDLGSGLLELVWVTAVGIGIGVAAGWAAAQLMRPPTTTSWRSSSPSSSPTAPWVVAENAARLARAGGGGGRHHHGQRGLAEVTPAGKVAIRSFWAVAAFGINSVLFLLIGLQLDFAALAAAAIAIGWGLLALTVGPRGRRLPDARAPRSAARRAGAAGLAAPAGVGQPEGQPLDGPRPQPARDLPHRDLIAPSSSAARS